MQRTLQTLIDEAAASCGNYAALARAIGVSPQRVNDYKAGRVPMTPATVGVLCDLLELPGEEAQRLAALAVVQSAKDSSLRAVLKRAFFGLWALCVVAPMLQTIDAQAAIGAARTAQPDGSKPTLSANSARRLLLLLINLAEAMRRRVRMIRACASAMPVSRPRNRRRTHSATRWLEPA